VLAKGAFVAGLPDGLELLRRTGTDGLLVDDAGVVHRSAGLARFTGTPGVEFPTPDANPAEPRLAGQMAR
jgi:hypothetical protein